MRTLKELVDQKKDSLIFDLPFDADSIRFDCPIAYYGPCWYSLVDGVFRAGEHATYCRIKILKNVI